MAALTSPSRRKVFTEGAEALKAAQVSFAACAGCGLSIQLHDAGGRIFAVATIPLEVAADAGASFANAVAVALLDAPKPAVVH